LQFVVVGIDAGVENTGIGVVRSDKDRERVLYSETVTTKPSIPIKGSAAHLVARDHMLRSREITRRVLDVIDKCGTPLPYVALELFGDQGTKRNRFTNRSATAALVGQLFYAIADAIGEDRVEMVNSSVVASNTGAMREVVGMWAAGVHVFDGDERLLSIKAREHERDAVAHAIHRGRMLLMEWQTR